MNMRRVAVECMRVLKPGKHCAILMGAFPAQQAFHSYNTAGADELP